MLALARLAELRADRDRYDWRKIARPNQLPPESEWRYWLVMAGRGYGKTRIGAEWVRGLAETNRARRIALIAPTASDARDVMIEGESGLLAVSRPDFRPVYEPSKRRVTWPNGAMATAYSADEPERLRGPQHDAAWGDEIAAWQYIDRAFMLMDHGLRLPPFPRGLLTTTPKPLPLLRKLMARDDVVVTRGTSYENRDNLAPDFFRALAQYDGTTIGRQEIYGELIDPSEGAILKRQWWRMWPQPDPPQIDRILLSFDTAFKDAEENDFSAMTVWGVFRPDDDKPANAILLDAWREKLLFPDLRERAAAEVKRWTFDLDPPMVLIEDKGSGPSLLQELSRAGVSAWPWNPGREAKDMRAHVVSDVLHGGRIWAPSRMHADGSCSRTEFRDYAEQVITDCEVFPLGEHDDLVDTCVQAWAYLRQLGTFSLDSDWKNRARKKRSPLYYGMRAA